MKKAYLSEEEIDDITVAIYNDVNPPIYEDVSEDVGQMYNEEAVKELFKEVEYIQIPDQEHYIITQQGRVFNTKRLSYVQPTFSTRAIYVYLYKTKHSFKHLFEYAGWDYSYHDILKTYKTNKWRILVLRSLKEYWKSL